MNGKTARLLRAYARISGRKLPEVKREWLDTPAPMRGKVGAEMQSGIWSTTLRDWRARHKLQQKEAADILNAPLDTYRGWESMKRTPAKFVRIALTTTMKNWNPSSHPRTASPTSP